jgi:hypothetical protein
VDVGGDVHVPRELPHLRPRRDGVRAHADPGVRAEQVDGAERLARPRHERGDLLVRRHVAAHAIAGAPRPAATRSAPAASRSDTTTRAPSAAKRSAMARPMPDAAPVTTATLPLSSMAPTVPRGHRARTYVA